MSRIYDNIDLKFAEGLKQLVSNSGVKRVDFCVGYFNLRGWGSIADLIDKLPGCEVYEKDEPVNRICRLLIGMQRTPEELVQGMYSASGQIPADTELVRKCKRQMAAEFKKQLVMGVPTSADETALQKLSKQMKEGRVCVKLFARYPLHAKLYLAHRPDDSFNPIMAMMGSSNLTYAGLNANGELDAEFADRDDAKKFADWFDKRWEDNFCVDITEELAKIIDESWASEEDIPPYYIYLKTAYHLSQEARDGIKEYVIPPEFKHTLFDFQATAVKLAAKHLDKYGGAMIGDVVGLGKTITACAIAKVYEMRNSCSTAIICPANLTSMWKGYIKDYDLKADVYSNAKHLDYKNLKYYRLIIVDESHNLRNSDGARYKNLKDFIQYQNSKVLLLTATPYNKEYKDLSNQLRLFLPEEYDLGIKPEAYIRTLQGDREFSVKHPETFIRGVGAFEKSYEPEDWQELMRLFLVRRTRTFIKDNYAKTDDYGRKYLEFPDGTKSYFPERIPRAVKFKTVANDQFSRLYSDQMMDMMGQLKLPRYGLSKYISPTKQKNANGTEQQILANLSKAGVRMMGFCRTNFFKRMDSSGLVFLISIHRHILRNAVYLYAIEKKLPFPIGAENALAENFLDDEDVENHTNDLFGEPGSIFGDSLRFAGTVTEEKYKKAAQQIYERIVADKSSSVSWIDSNCFTPTLKRDLKADCTTLMNMLEYCNGWDPDEDEKLNELYKLLTGEFKDEKAIVFTQFSDTAAYIAKQLQNRGVKNVGCVTGDSEDPTAEVGKFSPISNKVENPLPADEQYRILVATDVLSEGQNLQDAHIIINFDLPWAIIRLIQRAGRVDRIGQESEVIYCCSFFPSEGVEKLIRLKERLSNRIKENADVVGSDEVFFEGDETNIKDLYTEKKGVLDEEEDGEVDLASYAYQIWKSATEEYPGLKNIIPNLSNVIYSTKENTEEESKQGVITYAKTPSGSDMLMWMDVKENIVTQSQKTILDALACDYDTPAVNPPLDNHHELVKRSIKEMQSVKIPQGGILGPRFSTKNRLFTLLDTYCKDHEGTFFVTDDLKLSVDDIYNYPMYEEAKYILGQMLRRNASPEEIIATVVDFRNEDKLVIRGEENAAIKEPQIICSMGLKNKSR